MVVGCRLLIVNNILYVKNNIKYNLYLLLLAVKKP
jgi:hypothetical protein